MQFDSTFVHDAGTVRSVVRGKCACTSFCSAVVLVSDWIRTIEVHILVAHEATMFVLLLEVGSCDRIPRIAHPRLDVRFRERAGRKNTLPPEVEEGVVERREAFRCCRWHLDHFTSVSS